MEYTGASNLEPPLRKASSMMKRYSRVVPPCRATSSPAALADPPGVLGLDIWFSSGGHHELTGCDEIIHDDNGLARFDGVCLHLEGILKEDVSLYPSESPQDPCRSIFLFVRRRDALAREFTPFPHRYKGSSEPQRDNGTQKKTTSIQAYDNIDLTRRRLGNRVGRDMV